MNAHSLSLHIDISFLIIAYDIHFNIVMQIIGMFAYLIDKNKDVYIILWGTVKFEDKNFRIQWNDINISIYFPDTCNWIQFTLTTMFKVLTHIPQDFSKSRRPTWIMASCPWMYYGISQRYWKEIILLFSEHCAWWWPSTPWGAKMFTLHIDDQGQTNLSCAFDSIDSI